MDDEMILNDQMGENSEQMESDIAFPQSVSYTDMARAALTLAKKRNSDRGAAVLRKSAETGLPATFWQQADNSLLTPQKGTVDQLPDSGKRALVENPQVADIFKNDLRAVNRIFESSETGEEKRAVLKANLPANWQSMISAAREQGLFKERYGNSEYVNRLSVEELADTAIRAAMNVHLEAKGKDPHLVQLGNMLIWGEAAQKILTPTDSSVFARYYARRGFTPLQMEYCQFVLGWRPLDAKTLPNGRTKVTQWEAIHTAFMQGRNNDPIIYKTAEDIPAAAVPLWLRKQQEQQRRLALAGEHRHDFDSVKTMRQLRNGTNGAEYVRQLMMEIRTMAVLTQRYGDKWHDFNDEALEEAFKSVEAETGVPAVMLSAKRFRPADAGSFDKIEKLWDFFGAGSLAERVVRAHGDELLEIYKNSENATYADNLALVENSGLEELHRQMRGKTWGYQLLNVGADVVPLVVETLVTGSPAPSLATRVSAKTFLRKAAAFLGKRALSELPTVMVNTANAVEDYRIDWLTGEIGDRKDVMETFSQQFLNTSVEILSEVMGGAVSGFVGKGMRAGLTKALPESVKQSIMASTIAGAYNAASQKAFVKAAKKVAEAGGWTDTLSEYLEEKGGDALRFALTRIGEAADIPHLNLGQESIFGSVQEEAELFSLVAALGVGFGTIPAIATGVDVAKAMAYSNRQLELNKRIQESEAAKSSPEATGILLRQYTRFQEEAAYLHEEDAAAIIESNPEIAEKLGINTELVDYAIDHGVSVPVDMVAAQTRLDTPELQTLLDNIIPPSGGGMTIKEIRDLSLEQSDLDRAQTIDNERKAVRAAIEEKVSQLESLGRPAKEIRAFTRLMSFADYLARHSNTSVSQWIKNLKIQQMKEADFLRMLEEVPEGVQEGVRYSTRMEPPPKKTRRGYKLFAVFKNRPGQLFPPMVANPGGAPTDTGIWLNADAAPRAADSKTGRAQVQAGGKGTNAGKQSLSYRPGWHLGEIPYALQFNVKDPETGEAKSLFPDNFVWAECEYAADVDYQQEAESYGYTPNGKYRHSYAGLPRIPKDGAYMYRTNPNPETDPWVITGAMKVLRVLSDAEVDDLVRKAGRTPQKRLGGPINLAEFGLDNKPFTGRKVRYQGGSSAPGEAANFFWDESRNISIPIVEVSGFSKEKDIQGALAEYIRSLRGSKTVVESDGMEVSFNKASEEYAESDYTNMLRKKATKLFKTKAKAATAIKSIIAKARNGINEGVQPGHESQRKKGGVRRYDVDFAVPSGNNEFKLYTGELTVLLRGEKRAVFYDITNIKLDRKSPAIRLLSDDTHSASPEGESDLHRLSVDGNNIPPAAENVNPETEKKSKIFNQGEGSRKGAISFGEAFEATITVFEGKGDLSTLCHETGHYILEMMRRLVASDLGDAQMESDLQALEKWMAQDTADLIAQDEKLARGFEQYLREGKSPSPKLDGAFATFREILRRIYHTVKMLNVEINDEVRNVFDRILSSDQTVSNNAFLREVAQKLDLGLLGLNDEERKSFTGLMAQANQQAITQMEKEKASQLKALKTQWRKDAKNAMAEMPEYAVREEIKVLGCMDYDSVKELVGEDIANKLHDRGLAVKKRTNQKGEINAFFPAEFLPADGSFESLEGMLRTLAEMEPPADFTSRYLAEREAEFNAEFEMSEAALTTQASVDSYDRLIELLAVKGGQEGYRIRRQEMKAKAQEIIEQLSVGGILSKKLDNDCRAGLRKVVSAANKKDYATAFEEARKLRANIEVLRLRGAAKERISRFGQLMKKVRNAKLGKIEGTHQDALTALSVLWGLYRPKTVEARWGKALKSILDSLKEEYDGIGELEALLDQTPLKERAYGDFLQLAQFAEYIYEAGRAEVSDGKMAFKRQVSEDVNAALEAMGDIPPGKAKRNGTGVSAKTLNYAFDNNEQLRNIWGKMCGNDVESPAYAPYKRLMVAASEQLRLQQPLLRKVGDALKALTNSGKKWDMEGLPTIPESIVNAGNYTRWTPDMVLAVCLNLGCAKNRQRLQEAYGFTDVDLENIAGRLSKADWDNIQMVWDAINAPELVSAAQKAYRDEFFADMPLEEAFSFDVRSSDAQDLQIKGGYYPLAYLPDIGTPDGSVNTESADSNPLRRPGFTYSRKEGVKRAIRLSPTVAIGHINDVAHYATHREAVRLMARIIGDSQFRRKFQESQGFNRYRTLVKRVQAVANPKEFIQSMGDMERYLRSVLTTSALWGNLSTAGMQFASAFVGVDEVKGYYLPSLMATWAHTLKDYVSGNAEGRMDTPYARAVTLSGLMRDRMNLRDYDLGALRSRMDKGLFSAILKPVNMAGFMLSNAMDTMVTVPIWDAAYRQAVDEGKSVEEAVAVADELVAKTQGAYRPLDQTSAQTDPGFVRYATAFMSPAVAQFNTTLRAFRKLKTQGLKESWMAIACSVASPLLLGALIRWAYAGDDEDKAERAVLRETIGFWSQGIPVVRDIVDAVINASTGGWQGGSAVSTTVGEGVEALQKPLVAAGKAVEKQEFERAVWKLAEAVSIALKAPVIPAYRRLRKTFMDHGADKYFLPPVPGDKR